MVSVQRFCRYGLIGIGNTVVHWLLFFALHAGAGWHQAPSNVVAFALAASLSYRLNAYFTFGASPDRLRYLMFVAGMGALSFLVGALSDLAGLPPLLTLLTFSGLSLVAGYCYSHTVVFKRKAP